MKHPLSPLRGQLPREAGEQSSAFAIALPTRGRGFPTHNCAICDDLVTQGKHPKAKKLLLLALLAALAACAPHTDITPTARPTRIVSLDYCADQFVVKLANRADIVALSPDATKPFSYMRQQAQGLAQVRATAEEVLALRPDLIVRSYGGDPNAQAFFGRAGIKVHQIGWGDDFEAVRINVREAARAMGQEGRGAQTIADFDHRLSDIAKANGQATLYVTPGGISAGPDTMVGHMLTAAGLSNFQNTKGWHPLPLEQLVSERPDRVAQASFGSKTSFTDYWSSARHAIMAKVMREVPVTQIDGATTSCAGWFVVDGVEALAKGGPKQ